GGVESFLQVFHQGLALRVQAMGSDTAVVSTCGAVAVHVAHRTRQGAEPQRLVQMYRRRAVDGRPVLGVYQQVRDAQVLSHVDRKSTRLNSSHVSISYAV